MRVKTPPLKCLELCAGAGGQALGLEQAGFLHSALVDIEPHCCATLRLNRPEWEVHNADIRRISGSEWLPTDLDLLAAGLPCPPFSIAGKKLGKKDERDLFPAAMALIRELRPRAVMIENVRGFLSSTFDEYRARIRRRFRSMGYEIDWRLFNASDFAVSQLRPRVVIVALRKELWPSFSWPEPFESEPLSVGDELYDLMCSGGWKGAERWRRKAKKIAPTLVGGSMKHGGPDLGPTRARRAWAELGVNAGTIAEEPPPPSFRGMPRLTIRMVARLQGFPDDWEFSGKKTAAYRQVGNAFPPPVARAVAEKLNRCLSEARSGQLAV